MKHIAALLVLVSSVFAGEKEQRIIALTILGEARGEGAAAAGMATCANETRRHVPQLIAPYSRTAPRPLGSVREGRLQAHGERRVGSRPAGRP